MGLGDQCHMPAALSPGKGPGTHCTEVWVGPGPVWTGVEKLALSWGETPNIQAHSESLYQLCNPGPLTM